MTTLDAMSAARSPGRVWMMGMMLLVVAAAIAMRWSINFAQALPGGMDAAYYPMQSWWLLEHGRLAYNDLPLIFVLGAGLAKILMVTRGMDVDSATMLASRVIDSVLPPLAAVAILGLGWTWLARERRTRGVALGLAAAACVVTLSVPAARMVGDFQKNSLGLVWLVASVWAAREAFAHGGAWRWCGLAAAVGLAAMTHVAALGATVLVIGVAMVVFFARQREWTLTRAARVATVSIAVGALLWAGVYLASPRRAIALAQAPIKLFAGERDGRAGPSMGPRMEPGERPEQFGGSEAMPRGFASMPDDGMADGPPLMGGPRGGRGTGPGGGPGGGVRIEGLIAWFVYPVSLLALWRLWLDRAALSAGDVGVVVGLGAGALVLACPLMSGEYAQRLSLMAPVPAAMLWVFLVVRRAERGATQWPSAVVAALALVPLAGAMGWVTLPGPDGRRSIAGQAIISEGDAAEMLEVRGLINDPTRTLVVAPHGLEWWAGYFLKTAVAEGSVPEDAFVRYDRVFALEQIRGRGERPGGRMGARGPGLGGSAAEAGLDVVFEGEHLRLSEYPIPGE